LGHGEVQATLRADGVSTLQETGISGLWWIEHRDARGELIAELLEVATTPAILAASTEDMVAASRALRSRLEVTHSAAARMTHATLS
jgi:hydrogenase-1 operon protein HyaF